MVFSIYIQTKKMENPNKKLKQVLNIELLNDDMINLILRFLDLQDLQSTKVDKTFTQVIRIKMLKEYTWILPTNREEMNKLLEIFVKLSENIADIYVVAYSKLALDEFKQCYRKLYIQDLFGEEYILPKINLKICFNEVIQMMPNSTRTVVFDDNFDSVVQFNNSFGLNYDGENVPPNIESCTFGRDFNRSVILPESLKVCNFGREYNQVTLLPRNLKSCTFGRNYNQSLQFQKPNNNNIIKEIQLEELTFGRTFNQPIVLPPNAKTCVFGRQFNSEIVLLNKKQICDITVYTSYDTAKVVHNDNKLVNNNLKFIRSEFLQCKIIINNESFDVIRNANESVYEAFQRVAFDNYFNLCHQRRLLIPKYEYVYGYLLIDGIEEGGIHKFDNLADFRDDIDDNNVDSDSIILYMNWWRIKFTLQFGDNGVIHELDVIYPETPHQAYLRLYEQLYKLETNNPKWFGVIGKLYVNGERQISHTKSSADGFPFDEGDLSVWENTTTIDIVIYLKNK